MIVELNDSIPNQVKTQIPAKNQNLTPAKSQIQAKTQVPVKSQSQTKTQSQVQSQTKAKTVVPVKTLNEIEVSTNQSSGNTQVSGNTKTATNKQTSSNAQPLTPLQLTDSIQKSQAVNDSIQKAKKDSIESSTMPLFYKEQFIPGDSIKWTSMGHHPSGFEGSSLPYRLRTDDGITGLLLLCFIITSYVFAFGKKSIIEHAKNLFSRKEQIDFFGKATASDLRHRLMLRLQTCILMGIFIFDYFHDYNPLMINQKSIYFIVGTYIGICLAFYAMKWMLYKFLGWVFLDKSITYAWVISYSTIINYLGFCFFPLVLLMVYFDLSTSIILIIGLILVIFTKIVMFYKWLKFFFTDLHGVLYLIVYFCALEILPCFLLVQGLLQTNIILQLKL